MPFFFLPLHGCACVYFPSPLLCLQAINHLHVWLKNTDPGSIFRTFFFFIQSGWSANWQELSLRASPGIGREIKGFAAAEAVSVEEGVCGHLPSWKLLWSDYSLERLGAPRLPYCAFFFSLSLSVVASSGLLLQYLWTGCVFTTSQSPFFSFMTLMAAKPSAFSGRSFPVACVAARGPSFTASHYLY